MKRAWLAMAGLLLAAVATLAFVRIDAVLKRPAALYPSDENTPLDQRVQGSLLAAGARVEVIRCIDDKSDQYLQVLTAEGEYGYLYDLDIRASLSLARNPNIRMTRVLPCALFLVGRG